MLDKDQIEAASRTLRDHWRAGTKLAALDASHRPRDRREAYAIQAALEHHSAGNLFGWKIAATSEAGQKHINVDGPMAGRILSETVLADGGTASMAGNEMAGRRTRIRLSYGERSAAAIVALFRAAGSRCGRRFASGNRDS